MKSTLWKVSVLYRNNGALVPFDVLVVASLAIDAIKAFSEQYPAITEIVSISVTVEEKSIIVGIV
ncbi:MAG: hypothetical protein RL755_31 [Pseudomonadota bacterium]|jgi:hypothetical protein